MAEDIDMTTPSGIGDLQERIFELVMSDRAISSMQSMNPRMRKVASSGLMAEVAVEIVAGAPERYGDKAVDAVMAMPNGLAKMVAIEKFSAVFSKIDQGLQEKLKNEAKSCIDRTNSVQADQKYFAVKFLIIIDNLLSESALGQHIAGHQNNTGDAMQLDASPINNLSNISSERYFVDRAISGANHAEILEHIEKEVEFIEEQQVMFDHHWEELRRHAYALRRVSDGLDRAETIKIGGTANAPNRDFDPLSEFRSVKRNGDRNPETGEPQRMRERTKSR